MLFGYEKLSQLPRALHHLLEERAASHAQQPFVTVDGETLSYDALLNHSNVMAVALHRHGVRAGDRVVVMMQSSAKYLSLWFAISRLGAIEVPVNGAYRGEMLTHIVTTAKPTLAIIDDEFREAFMEATFGVIAERQVLSASGSELAYTAGHIADAEDVKAVTASVGSADPACVVFTSGTTGRSKGVVMSHHQQMTFGYFFAQIVGFRPDDISYNFLPFFHIAAKFQSLATMLAGGKMLLRCTFSLSRFWEDVHESQATICLAVGGLCHMLNSQPATPDDAQNTLRVIYAVPVPWEFKDAFERRFGLQLVEGYGGTESNLNVYSRLGEHTPRGSCGRASDYFDVAILDEIGEPVPTGESGEICVRPKHPNTMMSGYLDLPEKTLETMRGYWFHSGDRGFVDSEGFVYFLDRMKDAIRRRGENISSFEVERFLNEHPDVAEVAVVPINSEIGEDEVRAVVILRDGAHLTHESLLRYAIEKMPYFMVPRFIEFRTELPRTPTMKVKKAELRAEGPNPATWDCERVGIRITRRGLESI